MATMGGRRIHYVHDLHQKYGPYVRLSPNEIAVNSAQGFKQIHAINSGFRKSEWYQSLVSMGRLGVFNMTDPAQHAARRKLFARPFSKTFLREHWEGVVREEVAQAVSKIESSLQTEGVADVFKWWTFMTNDVSSGLMFGESFHTLEHGEENEFIRTMAKALAGGGIGAELPLVRQIGRRLPLQTPQEFFNAGGILQKYAQSAVDNMKAAGGGRNIFSNIMAELEKGEYLDDTDVKVEAANFIVAGTDTTAVSLTYLTYAVLSRPSIQSHLVQEVAGLPDGYGDVDLEALPLLNAVIQETLRLYGAAPGMLPRIVPPGGIDMNGYFLPEGTTATTQSFSLHRDPLLFPEPEAFTPERFLPSPEEKDGHRLSGVAKAVFSPFGAGSRSCLGIHLAYMELRLATAEFFRRCGNARLAPSATPKCMEQENYFLVAPKGHKCEIVM